MRAARRRPPVRPRKPVRRARKAAARPAAPVTPAEREEIRSLRAELKRRGAPGPARWSADPKDVERSVARLVLSLVEFLRQLMERQAVRRMEAGTLTPQEVETLGVSLMRLEEAVRDMAERFGIPVEDLNLELGPLGKLM